MELRGVLDAGLARAVIRPALAALAALTALRLLLAAVLPLAPDEAYYWVWSRALAAGYYDHPPMVAFWIALGTAIAGDAPLGVRLLGPVAAALGTLLLADAAERLLPGRRAGLVAAALFNATLIMGVGSVVITPDSPLLLFWATTIWALSHVVATPAPVGKPGGPPGGQRVGQPGGQPGRLPAGRTGWWIVAGLSGGLALASKYTAAFLGLGIGGWLLLTPAMRPWLRRPGPWAGLAAALLVFAPVIAWNAAHDWAGFLRQGGRVASWQFGRALQFQAELIGGQAGLATPLVWVLAIAGMAWAARRAWADRDAAWSLLAWLSAPATAYMVWYAMGARVQGNWPAIVYPAALLAAAAMPDPRLVRLRRPAIILGLVITALTCAHAATRTIRLPIQVDPIALRLSDWDVVARHVDQEQARIGAAFVASDQYALAAAMAWVLPSGTRVIGVEDRWRLFDLPRATIAGTTGILVRDSRDQAPFDPRLWRRVTPLPPVSRTDVQTLHLFQVEAASDDPTMVTLPRPAP